MTKGDFSEAPGRASSPPGIQSLEVGMRVLNGVATFSAAATLTEVAQSIGMDLSTCRRYLVSLVNTGMVRQEQDTGKYVLGHQTFLLGLCALSRNDRIRLATDRALALNRELDMTVLVSVWGDLGPTVVAWFDRSIKLMTNSHIGSVYPLLSTATGRTFLAYQPQERSLPLLRREFGLPPESALREEDMQQVTLLRDKTRTRGMGATDGNVIPGLDAIAAPVFDTQGNVAAVIAIIAESKMLRGTAGKHTADILIACAAEASCSQGFLPGKNTAPSFAQWLEGNWKNALNADASLKSRAVRRRRSPSQRSE